MSVCPLEANLQMSSCPLEAVHTLGTYGHLTVRIVHGTYGHLTVPGTYGHLPVQTVPGTYGHLTVRTASMGHTDISLYEQCYSVTNQQTETTHIYIEISKLKFKQKFKCSKFCCHTSLPQNISSSECSVAMSQNLIKIHPPVSTKVGK